MLRPFISDAKHFSTKFQSCIFSFVARNGNKTVHDMAQMGRSSSLDVYWVEDTPRSVLSMADLDRRFMIPP
ncbi:hypothetical protein V6N13_064812 [Hibiscus sabdariffa]|uniref:RNase H type-1 domain-containing protein n=1 Tax=Hibiscus sabdariffa TaxID=183260 RepID=A0ABR2EB76_9ROSI